MPAAVSECLLGVMVSRTHRTVGERGVSVPRCLPLRGGVCAMDRSLSRQNETSQNTTTRHSMARNAVKQVPMAQNGHDAATQDTH